MDVSTLPNDPAQLRGIIAKMAAQHEAALANHVVEVSDLAAQYEAQLVDKDQYIADLQDQVRLLKALRYAAQSEKAKAPHHEQQFYLFDEAEVAGAQGADLESEVSQVAAHRRKKGGRRPISPDYPRVEVVHDIPDEDKVCACGCRLTRIGEEVSEKLDIVPQKIQVIRHIRPKYACRACEGVEGEGATVKIAALPPQIIPQGIVTPGLLAYVLVNKFCDGLPFYRQQSMFARLGVDISRATMSGWALRAAEACQPLVELMHQELRAGPLIN